MRILLDDFFLQIRVHLTLHLASYHVIEDGQNFVTKTNFYKRYCWYDIELSVLISLDRLLNSSDVLHDENSFHCWFDKQKF